jgi:hypothetical protein
MANPNIGQVIAATWTRLVTDKPEDNIFYDRWLFDQFTTKNGGIRKVTGGERIGVSVEYAINSTFRSYSDAEVLEIQPQTIFDEAQYTWAEHSGTINYSVRQEWVNSGDSQKFDLIAGLVENAMNSHKQNIAKAMFGTISSNAKNINGLQDLVASSPSGSVSVGTINQATFSWWRNNQAAGTKTSAAFDNLRAKMRTMYNDCSSGAFNNHPTTIVTDQTVFEGYEGLLTANERNTSKSEGDAGYKNEVLQFKGAKIAFDEDCLAAAMYFLNPKFIYLVVAKDVFMKLGKELEPVNQHVRVRKIHSILQFVASQRRRLGVLTACS